MKTIKYLNESINLFNAWNFCILYITNTCGYFSLLILNVFNGYSHCSHFYKYLYHLNF